MKPVEVEGKIYRMLELKDNFESGYKKRDILVEVPDGEYNGKARSQILKFTTDKQRTDALNMMAEGDSVQIGYVPKGRMWTPPGENKELNFTDLYVVWIQQANAVPTTPQQASSNVVNQAMNDVPVVSDEYDSLPF